MITIVQVTEGIPTIQEIETHSPHHVLEPLFTKISPPLFVLAFLIHSTLPWYWKSMVWTGSLFPIVKTPLRVDIDLDYSDFQINLEPPPPMELSSL